MKPKTEIKFTPCFLKTIKTLDKKTQLRILREINILKTNPHAGKPLHGELKGIYSLRTGNYRTLYQIKENTILLLTVGHRKHAYE